MGAGDTARVDLLEIGDAVEVRNLAPQAIRMVGDVARESLDTSQPPFGESVLEGPVRLVLWTVRVETVEIAELVHWSAL